MNMQLNTSGLMTGTAFFKISNCLCVLLYFAVWPYKQPNNLIWNPTKQQSGKKTTDQTGLVERQCNTHKAMYTEIYRWFMKVDKIIFIIHDFYVSHWLWDSTFGWIYLFTVMQILSHYFNGQYNQEGGLFIFECSVSLVVPYTYLLLNMYFCYFDNKN